MLNRSVVTVAVAALLALGIGLRFYGLGDYFSHIDDMVAIAGPYMVKQGQPFTIAVPGTAGRLVAAVDSKRIKTNPLVYAAYLSNTTYAPLQYLAYPLVLHGEYSYRAFMVRGRLVSAMCGALALVAFLLAYRVSRGSLDTGAVVGITAVSLSLMNITYSQQAMSYAIGVLGCAVLMHAVARCAERDIDLRRLGAFGALGVVLSYGNYQVLAMVPLAFAALFVTEWRSTAAADRVRLIRRFVLVGAGFGIAILPAVLLIRARDWPGRLLAIEGFRPYFPVAPDGDVFARALYFVTYGAAAAYRVIWTDMTFAVESATGSACVAVMFALAVLGAVALSRPKTRTRAALSTFIGFVIVSWGYLNVATRLPLSPTRHVLAATPIIGLLVAFGVDQLSKWLNRRRWLVDMSAFALVAVMVITFGMHYGRFRADRTDRFDEAAFAGYLDRYHLDTIVGYERTWNPALMLRQSAHRPTFIDLDALVTKGSESRIVLPPKPLLLVSQYGPIEQYPDRFAYLRERGYQVRPLLQIASDVEPGISRAIKWGTNGLYVAIAERDERAGF